MRKMQSSSGGSHLAMQFWVRGRSCTYLLQVWQACCNAFQVRGKSCGNSIQVRKQSSNEGTGNFAGCESGLGTVMWPYNCAGVELGGSHTIVQESSCAGMGKVCRNGKVSPDRHSCLHAPYMQPCMAASMPGPYLHPQQAAHRSITLLCCPPNLVSAK